MRIYVRNLSTEVTEEELRHEFRAFGEVTSVIIVKNRYYGSSRGFGFVEMLRTPEGQVAITNLNGKVLKEDSIFCNAIRDWSEFGGT